MSLAEQRRRVFNARVCNASFRDTRTFFISAGVGTRPTGLARLSGLGFQGLRVEMEGTRYLSPCPRGYLVDLSPLPFLPGLQFTLGGAAPLSDSTRTPKRTFPFSPNRAFFPVLDRWPALRIDRSASMGAAGKHGRRAPIPCCEVVHPLDDHF